MTKKNTEKSNCPQCGGGSIMGTPEIFVCRSCDAAWHPAKSAGGPGIPEDLLNYISASVSYEQWFLAPSSVYRLDNDGRGIDDEDASISVKIMTEKLDLASRAIRAARLLKTHLADARVKLEGEGLWKGSFLNTEISAIASYSLICSHEGLRSNHSDRVSITNLRGDGDSGNVVFPSGSISLGIDLPSLIDTVEEGSDRVFEMSDPERDEFEMVDESVSHLFSFSSPRCIWRNIPSHHPFFVSAEQTSSGVIMQFDSWGSYRHSVRLPGSLDQILKTFDPLTDMGGPASGAISAGPAPADVRKFAGISHPIDTRILASGKGDHPLSAFVFSGEGFRHTGVISEDERGRCSGLALIDEIRGGEVRLGVSRRIQGSTKDEMMESVLEKQRENPGSYFESVEWRAFDNDWSRMFDIRAMDFWTSREFWRYAGSCPDGSPRAANESDISPPKALDDLASILEGLVVSGSAGPGIGIGIRSDGGAIH